MALLKFLITRDGEATAWELERFAARSGAQSGSVIRDLAKRGILELADYGQYRITKAGRDVVKDFEGIWEAAQFTKFEERAI